MKLRLRILLISMILFSLVACNKEVSKEGTNGPGPAKGDFYATIAGKLWNADSLEMVLVSSNGVSINGLSKTGDQISILLPAFQVGTYTLDAQSLSYALSANVLSGTSVFVSNAGTSAGTVVIASIDTINRVVSGSFEFTLTNPADNTTETVAKGVFDYLPYAPGLVGSVPPAGASKDTLEVTVDGNKFFASDVEISDSAGQMLIAGFSGTQDVGLFFPSDITAGTYNLDFTAGLYIGVYNPDPSTTLLSQSGGTLTIISNNTTARRITGTFNFNATPVASGPTANLTQGYFAANY